MDSEYRRLIYIALGFIPLTFLVVGAVFIFLIGTHEGSFGGLFMVTLGGGSVFAYYCGFKVLFKTVTYEEKIKVIAGLAFGACGCVAFGVYNIGLHPLGFLFYVPAGVGVCLIFEVLATPNKSLNTDASDAGAG